MVAAAATKRLRRLRSSSLLIMTTRRPSGRPLTRNYGNVLAPRGQGHRDVNREGCLGAAALAGKDC